MTFGLDIWVIRIYSLTAMICKSILYTQEELQWYGVDWTGPISIEDPTDDVARVVLPPLNNPLPRFLYDILIQNIDVPSVEDPEHMYIVARSFVHTFAPS